MRLTHILIKNIAAFTHFEANLKPVCLITGSNEVGKTSLINSIKYLFGTGHDPDMIREGAESGEILGVFDDGSQVKCRATRTPSYTTRGWKAAGAKKFDMNRKVIDSIANAISYDPLAFMNLSDKAALETLLKVMPITVDPMAIKNAIGEWEINATSVIRPEMNGLEAINAIYDLAYKERHSWGVQADAVAKHASQLEQAIGPEPDGEDWATVADDKARKLMALEYRTRDAVGAVNLSIGKAKEQFNTERRSNEATIDGEINRQIADLEKLRASSKVKVQMDTAKSVDTMLTAMEANKEAILDEAAPLVAALQAEIATATERARTHLQNEGTKNAYLAALKESVAYKTKRDDVDAAMKRLADLKVSIASNLPIKGISFKDGRIVDDKGVPLKKWNEATRIKFCLRIGVLAHGEAGLLLIDGAQAFDREHREMLVKTAEKYAADEELQFIIARVAETGLTVGASGEEFVG